MLVAFIFNQNHRRNTIITAKENLTTHSFKCACADFTQQNRLTIWSTRRLYIAFMTHRIEKLFLNMTS